MKRLLILAAFCGWTYLVWFVAAGNGFSVGYELGLTDSVPSSPVQSGTMHHRPAAHRL
jgi:hypothetical protein